MWRALAQLKRQDEQHRQTTALWETVRQNLPSRIDPSVGGLTICSVAYRAKSCLDLNERLIRALNPHAPDPTWLLFDNNVEPSEQIGPDDRRFTVLRQTTRDIEMGYEHALGISTLLAHVRSRFLLVLDPDCFIVLPDWIRRVTDHMIARELGFFGTPINPRRHNSYRYFPYMVCMFVDLARVPLRDLCFLPGVWELWTNLTYRMRKSLADVPKIGFLFRWLLTEQLRTNGWHIKTRFGVGRDVHFECAQPVWDVNQAVPRFGVKRMIHAMTPASVSPVPKKPGYCSTKGFRSMLAPDVDARGWEEFVWQEQPFAFHLGRSHSRRPEEYLPQLANVLDAFARRAPATPALAVP